MRYIRAGRLYLASAIRETAFAEDKSLAAFVDLLPLSLS
jgi:hypothetical protein